MHVVQVMALVRGSQVGRFRACRAYLRQFAATLTDSPVTAAAVVRWITDHREWSTQTCATAACAVRSWLRWADDPDLPTPQSIPVPRIPVPRRRYTVPDRDVLAAVEHATADTALMILLAREAGLRRAEIAQVHAGDIDPRSSLLVHGKGGKDRTVPVSALLNSALTAAVTRHPHGYLFPGPDAGHISPQSVYGRIRRAVHVNPHSLRHAFATACYTGNGHDLRAVQELLGHESVVTTQRYVAVGCGQPGAGHCLTAGVARPGGFQ